MRFVMIVKAHEESEADKLPSGHQLAGTEHFEVEIRQISQADELGDPSTPELREQERRMGDQILANANR